MLFQYFFDLRVQIVHREALGDTIMPGVYQLDDGRALFVAHTGYARDFWTGQKGQKPFFPGTGDRGLRPVIAGF